MAAPVTPVRQVIRIPNLPMGAIVDKDGLATDDELTFRQILVTNLQKLFGSEGVVLPSLTTTEITDIAAHQQSTPSGMIYTCQFGTQVYNSTLGTVMIAVEFPLASGIPVFKTVTLT